MPPLTWKEKGDIAFKFIFLLVIKSAKESRLKLSTVKKALVPVYSKYFVVF